MFGEKDLKGSRLSYYMPRDYSNTLFYKVACNNPAIKDFNAGHTLMFAMCSLGDVKMARGFYVSSSVQTGGFKTGMLSD